MQIGTVTSAPAVRSTAGLYATASVTRVQRIAPDWVEGDPLDALTGSDRALLGHLYGLGQTGEDDAEDASPRTDSDKVRGATVDALAREINRERQQGTISGQRDLTTEDVRRVIGRLTVTGREPVPVQVQVQLMTMLKGSSSGRLDVVL